MARGSNNNRGRSRFKKSGQSGSGRRRGQSSGRGWFGDPEEHAQAARGEEVRDKGG